MNMHLLKKILFFLMAACPFFCLKLEAEAFVRSETSFEEPHILAQADAGGIPYYLGVSNVNDMYYLFLPSNTNFDEITVAYIGEKKLYNPATEKTISYGETTVMSFKRGENYIYEYDEDNDKYYKSPIYVYAGANINSIFIDLDNGDSGLIALNTSKSNTESGVMRIVNPSNEIIYDGTVKKITGHGNSSYDRSGDINTKNSYNIKLEKKAELIQGAGKSKKWILLSSRRDVNSFDSTGIAQILGYYTYDALMKADAGYANVCAEYMDVFMNGEYRGTYILVEKIDNKSSVEVTKSEVLEDEECRIVKIDNSNSANDELIGKGIQFYQYYEPKEATTIETDVTGGYVLELSSVISNKSAWFSTAHGVNVRIKYPDNATKEQVYYIASYVQEFEDALFSETGYNALGKHFTEYADLNSMAAQTLVCGFYHNWEFYRTSTYIYKDSEDKDNNTLTFGPVWDFETNNNYYYYDYMFTSVFYSRQKQYCWLEQLWTHSEFLEYLLIENEEMSDVLETILGNNSDNRIFNLKDYADELSYSQEMNWLRWNIDRNFDYLVKDMLEGIEYRYNSWYNNLWNADNYLLKIDVKIKHKKNGTLLVAEADGVNNNDYVWYKINEEDCTKTIFVGTGKELLVEEAGKYFCTVSGPNNAYGHYWSEDPGPNGDYKVKCDGEIFGNTVITIKSKIYDTEIGKFQTGTIVSGDTIWEKYHKAAWHFTLLRGKSKIVFFRIYYSSIALGTLVAVIIALKGKRKKFKR